MFLFNKSSVNSCLNSIVVLKVCELCAALLLAIIVASFYEQVSGIRDYQFAQFNSISNFNSLFLVKHGLQEVVRYRLKRALSEKQAVEV